MNTQKLQLYTFLFILIIFNTTSKAQESNPIATRIDNYLSQGALNGFSGTILIAKQGQVILNKGYGYSNKKKKLQNGPNTIFTIGSVTKQFTATAILKLVSLNKLKTTDVLSTFFDNVPDDKKDISIHQLLTHSAGFISTIGDGDFDYIPTSEYFLRLFDSKLLHTPGTTYSYSNAGYSILARIIELQSNMEYEDFLQLYLFEPAGMQQTGYLQPIWKKNDIAIGYANNITKVGSVVKMLRKKGKVSWNLKGNGGINSTTGDMLKWQLALKQHRILSADLFEQLTKPNIAENENSTSHYAYGWAIYNSDRNTKIISHNGGNRVFFHDFIWLPTEDVLILLFSNANSRETEVAWILEKMIFDKNFTPSAIKHNCTFLITNFISKHDVNEAPKLTRILKKEYPKDLQNPNFLNNMGYTLLAKKKNTAWALEIFKLNCKLFPNTGNNWDSLGDAYKRLKDSANAISSYKKALNLDPYLAESIKSLAKYGIKVPLPTTIQISPSILNTYIGVYELKPNFTISIVMENGQLIVQATGRNACPTIATSNTKFTLKGESTQIEFNKNKRGKISGLTLFDNGQEMLAKRI